MKWNIISIKKYCTPVDDSTPMVLKVMGTTVLILLGFFIYLGVMSFLNLKPF